ncbi:uncharacterized [Tachysurus ichikawai]
MFHAFASVRLDAALTKDKPRHAPCGEKGGQRPSRHRHFAPLCPTAESPAHSTPGHRDEKRKREKDALERKKKIQQTELSFFPPLSRNSSVLLLNAAICLHKRFAHHRDTAKSLYCHGTPQSPRSLLTEVKAQVTMETSNRVCYMKEEKNCVGPDRRPGSKEHMGVISDGGVRT